MKNPNDVISGLVLLALCAVGAYSVHTLPSPTPPEVVGPAMVPTLALIAMAFCGLVLIIQGLVRGPQSSHRDNPGAVLKVLGYFGFFVLYLAGMVGLGELLADQSWFPWPHNGGFTIGTVLFLFISLRLLGRRSLPETGCVAVLTTAALLAAFGFFFHILLP